MSVPQSLRSESKLDVIIKARSLASYTIQITKNPKTFPPEYNNGITNKIIESATKIYPLSKGIKFLGFTFRLTDSGKVLMLLKSDNVKRERKKLFRLVKRCKSGKIPKSKVYDCYNAWKSHAKHGNNNKIIFRMDEYYKSLWKGENDGLH